MPATVHQEPGAALLRGTLKQRLLSGGAWVLVGQLSVAGMAVLSSALLARVLRPRELGAYFLVASLVGVATTIGQVGLPAAVMRGVSESVARGDSARAKGSIYATFRVLGIGLCAMALAIVVVGRVVADRVLHSPLVAGALWVAALWAIFSGTQGVTAAVFRGFQDQRTPALTGVGAGFVALVAFGGFWVERRHIGVAAAVSVRVIAGALMAIAGGAILLRKLRAMPPESRVANRELLEVGAPLLLNGLATYALMQADVWIVGSRCSESDVALYGSATRLVMLVGIPLTLVNVILPPVIAELNTVSDRAHLQGIVRAAASVAGLPALLVLLGFMTFGGSILSIVYGSYYAQGATLLVLLSLGQGVNVLAGSCGNVLAMTGHHRELARITVATSVGTVATAMVLVSWLGVVGVAVATALGVALQNGLMVWIARRRVGIWTYADLDPRSLLKLARRLSASRDTL